MDGRRPTCWPAGWRTFEGLLGHSAPRERGIDAQRRNELQDVGRRVYEYTWEHITKRPDSVTATLIERLDPLASAK